MKEKEVSRPFGEGGAPSARAASARTTARDRGGRRGIDNIARRFHAVRPAELLQAPLPALGRGRVRRLDRAPATRKCLRPRILHEDVSVAALDGEHRRRPVESAPATDLERRAFFYVPVDVDARPSVLRDRGRGATSELVPPDRSAVRIANPHPLGRQDAVERVGDRLGGHHGVPPLARLRGAQVPRTESARLITDEEQGPSSGRVPQPTVTDRRARIDRHRQRLVIERANPHHDHPVLHGDPRNQPARTLQRERLHEYLRTVRTVSAFEKSF